VELARELVGVDRLNREKGSDAAAKSVLSEMFRNQGAFVGGGPSYTIEKAAEDVVGIIQRMQHDSSTLELTQQLRSEKLRLEALLKDEKTGKEKSVAEAVAKAVAEKEKAVAEKAAAEAVAEKEKALAEKEKAVAEAAAQKVLIATLEQKLEELQQQPRHQAIPDVARDEKHKDASSSSKVPPAHGEDGCLNVTRFSYSHHPPKYLTLGALPNQLSTCSEIRCKCTM
jgi:colicin import membrane protein